MRVSDPPPVTVEARRGSTDIHAHTERFYLSFSFSPLVGRTSTHVCPGARMHTHTRVHMCGKVREKPLSLPLFLLLFLSPSLFLPPLSLSHPFFSLPFLTLQDVRLCVSRAETVAGRARSAESRYEIYGTLRAVAMGLKIYSRLHVLVNPITNMAVLRLPASGFLFVDV